MGAVDLTPHPLGFGPLSGNGIGSFLCLPSLAPLQDADALGLLPACLPAECVQIHGLRISGLG